MTDLIAKISLKNELSPELKKALDDLSRMSKETGALGAQLVKLRANKAGFLKGSIKSDIAELDKEKAKLLELKTLASKATGREKVNINAQIRSGQADLTSAYNREIAKTNELYKKSQFEQKKLLGTTRSLSGENKKSIKINRGVSESTNVANLSTEKFTNSIVRHIRQIESLVVAMYFMKKAYDSTLGVGHEFNKLIEKETMGYKLLIAQNLKNTDVTGRAVSVAEKYAEAQKLAADAISIVRKENLETPQTFAETAQVYKLIIPQLVKYGASLEQIGEITKKTSILSANMGIEFQQFIKTVDSAFTGEAKESGLKRALSQVGVTNEGIKKAKEAGKLVEYILEKMKNINSEMLGIPQLWDYAMGQFLNVWQELWGTLQKPLFESIKKDLKGTAKYLKDNKDGIISFMSVFKELAKQVAIGSAAFFTYKIAVSSIGSSTRIATALQLIWNRAVGESYMVAMNTGRAVSALRLMIEGLGRSLKSLFVKNLPMLALLAAFEAWSYLAGKAADAEQHLTDVINLRGKALEKLTKAQAIDNINKLEESLTKHREITQELMLQLKQARGRNHEENKETQELKAKLDTNKQSTREIEKQISRMERVKNGTYKANEAGKILFDTANDTAGAIDKAADSAYRMVSALGAASIAFQSQLLRAKELAGKATKTDTLKEISGLKLNLIAKQESELNKMYKKKNADVNKLNQKALELATKRIKIETDTRQSLKQIQEEETRDRKKAEEDRRRTQDRSISSTIAYREQLIRASEISGKITSVDAAKQIAGLKLDEIARKEKYINSLYKKRGENIDELNAKSKELYAQKLSIENNLKRELKLTKSRTKEIKKQHEALKLFTPSITMDKINEGIKKESEKFADDFASAFEGIFGGDITSAFESFFNNISTQFAKPFINDLSKSLSGMLSGLTSGLGNFGSAIVGGIISIGVKLLSGLFSGNKVSAAELKAAKGTVSIDNSTVVNVLKLIDYNTAQNMHYSKGILDNMMALAKATNRASMLLGDFTGVSSSSVSGLAGFSSKSSETVFSGVAFAKMTKEELDKGMKMYAVAFEKVLKKKSSFWGLSSSEKLVNSNVRQLAGNPEMDQITQAYMYGISAAQKAADALGISAKEFQVMTENWSTSLGTLNFMNKTPEEIASLLNAAIGRDLDSLVGMLDLNFTKFSKAGEGAMETLVRVAYEFETVQGALESIHRSLGITAKGALDFSQALIEASGGMDSLISNIKSFRESYYSEAERIAMTSLDLRESFSKLGIEMPKTKTALRSLIETTTDPKMLAQLLRMAGDFANVKDYYSKAAEENRKQIEENRKELEALMKAALDKERDFRMMLMKRNANETTALYKKQLDDELSIAKKRLSFNKDVLSRIESAYTGTISYMNSLEKSSYLGNLALSKLSNGDTNGYFDSLYKQLENDKKMSASKEDYVLKFDRYIYELKSKEPDTTLDDIEDTLQSILKQNKKLETAISKSSYQRAY